MSDDESRIARAWQRAMCRVDASAPSYRALTMIGLLAGSALLQTGCFLFRPCLSPVGPCLSIEPLPEPDLAGQGATSPDMRPAAPDMAPDKPEPVDVGPCLSVIEEPPPVGPCLSPIDLEEQGSLELTPGEHDARLYGALNREQILSKLAASLPADVVSRLTASDDPA